MTSPNLSEIVSTTLRERSGQFADNVTNKNALLTHLKEKGGIIKHDGGRTIVKELDYAENGTYKEYSGYENLDISASDVLSSAEYNWRQSAVTVTISGLEKRQNSGANAVANLLAARINNAMRTMANKTSVGIYSDGTGSGGKQIDGLQAIVADSPSAGTVGGINAATYSFWRNYASSAATSAGNIESRMNAAFNSLCRGSDMPNIIVADANYFGYYQETLQTRQRFTNDATAGSGFTNLVYMGNVPVILEGGDSIAANHMYFLNTDYLFFDVHKEAFMTPLPARIPTNQDAEVFPIILQCNLTCSNRKLQGVIFQ